MKQHIIITAFGTTTLAKNTYTHLDSLIKSRFPHSTIHWHFSSPAVRKEAYPLESLLVKLSKDTCNRIIVQSLHVSPGLEFHRAVSTIRESRIPASIGMPLLTTPEDHTRVAETLLPIISGHVGKAVLILGHGTYHPSWTVLSAFEAIIREIAGKHIFVTALEKYPSSQKTINRIVSAGFSEVLVIPLLMTAGMHFTRDIIGDSPESWKNKLKKENITLSLHNKGLGMLDGIGEIICDHIQQATA